MKHRFWSKHPETFPGAMVKTTLRAGVADTPKTIKVPLLEPKWDAPRLADNRRKVSAPSPPSLAPGPNTDIQVIHDAVQQAAAWVQPLRREMGRVIVGQEHLIDSLIIVLVANGHLLLEGVPGRAETPRSRSSRGFWKNCQRHESRRSGDDYE
jgi:hypothetical protein